MSESTLGAALRNTAITHPAVLAVVAGERRMSFAELDREADRLASGLLEAGVARGDRVGLWMQTCVEWIVTFCACARIGAVVVPINPRYKTDEVEYLLVEADLAVLVCERTIWNADSYELLSSMAPELANQESGSLALERFPRLRTIVVVADLAPRGLRTFRSLADPDPDLGRGQLAAAAAAVRETDPLLICFTSGSTGRPKGVVHTHLTLRHAEKIAAVLRLEPAHSLLANWPLYHVAGLFIVVVPAILRAATMVLLAHWSGAEALDLIERERISVIGGVATHYFDMVSAMKASPRDTSSIEVAYIGGSTLSKDTFDNIVQTLRLKRLLSTYGMTENTVSTTFNRWDDPTEICRQNKAPVITEGKVKIVDPVTLEDLPIESQGEIWCSGPTVMSHYYNRPDATRLALTDGGWLRTGDLGQFDDVGYLEITGRLKDIIKVGGTNVSPVEVETILMDDPAIAFAVVVGVPDERLGEVGYAYLQLGNPGMAFTLTDLRALCKPLMADYKIPRRLRIIAQFPRLSNGKIDRSLLARMALQQAS